MHFSVYHTEPGGPSGSAWNTSVHVQIYRMCCNSRELVKKIVFVFEVRCFPGHSVSRQRSSPDKTNRIVAVAVLIAV